MDIVGFFFLYSSSGLFGTEGFIYLPSPISHLTTPPVTFSVRCFVARYRVVITVLPSIFFFSFFFEAVSLQATFPPKETKGKEGREGKGLRLYYECMYVMTRTRCVFPASLFVILIYPLIVLQIFKCNALLR